MKQILHTADIHIGYKLGKQIDEKTGINRRICDYLDTLDNIVDYAIQNAVDLVSIGGDVFKDRTPSPTLQKEFAKRIVRLNDSGIKTVILKGNHDTPYDRTKASALDLYEIFSLENVFYAGDKICKVPFFTDEFTTIAVPCLDNIIKDNLEQEIEKQIDALVNEGGPKPVIVLAHYLLRGVMVGQDDFCLDRDTMLPTSMVARPGVDVVLMGDVHKHQVLQESPLVIYPGSIERVDFNEAEDPKGFVMAKIENGEFSWKFQQLSVRRYVTLEHDFTNGEPAVFEGYKDHVVKIKAKAKRGIPCNVEVPEAFHVVIDKEIVNETRNEIPCDYSMDPVEAIKQYFIEDKDRDRLAEKATDILAALTEKDR